MFPLPGGPRNKRSASHKPVSVTFVSARQLPGSPVTSEFVTCESLRMRARPARYVRRPRWACDGAPSGGAANLR